MPIRDWQIWNEPDHTFYWRKQPFVRRYVALLRAAHGAIKHADPHATVVMAGFATTEPNWPVIRRLYRAGARGAFDVFAVHPYTTRVRDVPRLVALARRQLQRVHDAKRPMWATEVTWPASKGHLHDPYGFAVSARRQATNVRQVFSLLATRRHELGLRRVFWESWLTGYSSTSNVFDYSGLRSPGRNRPSLSAFRREAHRLEGRG
jgi:polysaccharide biosynthesis protein PslG